MLLSSNRSDMSTVFLRVEFVYHRMSVSEDFI